MTEIDHIINDLNRIEKTFKEWILNPENADKYKTLKKDIKELKDIIDKKK